MLSKLNKFLFVPAIGVIAIAAIGVVSKPTNAAPKTKAAAAQKIVPPRVYLWADLSNGGSGMFGMGALGALGKLGFGMGGSNNNYSDAFHGAAGLHADLALQNLDAPYLVEGKDAIPTGLKLGSSIPLIPNPKTGGVTEKQYEPKDDIIPKYDEKPQDFKMTFYWGCGAELKKGNSKSFLIKNGKMSGSAIGLNGRTDPSQHQKYATTSALWPNKKDNRDIDKSAKIGGNHAFSGTNIPTSLAFAWPQLGEFMGDLGLKSSGTQEDIVTLNWNNVTGAQAYFFNAFGFREMANGSEMIMWSSADVPEPGYGLMNYLSPEKLAQYLKEKALLPSSQTSCQIPKGIFAGSAFVSVSGIGYGADQGLIYPARPADPKTTWVQEWSVRIRNKTTGNIMVGMPSMDEAMKEGAKPNQKQMTPEEIAKAECEKEKAKAQNAGKTLGGLLGGGLGSAIGGAIGKSKSKCPTN